MNEIAVSQAKSQPMRFKPGVLDAVQQMGEQFAGAALTVIPGGETLESQRDNGVIRFWTRWHFDPDEDPVIEPSIDSEVIYLPKVVPGTLRCSFDKTDADRLCVQEILDALPKVEGLQWIIGNAPTVNRVLASHLQQTQGREYLLRGEYTWTTDTYDSRYYGPTHLLVGYFHEYGVECTFLRPFPCHDHAWVFPLAVPA